MTTMYLLLITLFTVIYGYKFKCSDYTIPIEDIQDALVVSKAVYDQHLGVGKLIYKNGYEVVLDKEKVLGDEHTIRVIVAEKQYTSIVAFRGIDSSGELTGTVKAMMKDVQTMPIVFDGTVVNVNTKLWESFKLLYKPLKKKLQDQARKYIITGHSLGGALASLLAITAKEDEGRMWENPGSSLITFGQPRVGNKEYAEKHDEMIPLFRKLRFVMNLDPVPHLPLWPAAVHHSREIWISKRFINFKPSWFWKVCNSFDPLKCSNMWTFTPDVKDHDIRNYEQHIMSPPSLFFDKQSNHHLRWLDALIYTCEEI